MFDSIFRRKVLEYRMACDSATLFCSDRNCKWCEFYGWCGWACVKRYDHGCNLFSVVAIGTNAGIAPITCAVAGALLGFLLFNVYPASVFMGDTGSLALGGLFAAMSIATHTEFLAIILGGLFVMETLSDVIQVGYFKMTHKRVFKMAPIHHHFELKGWPEVKVVIRFWMIELLFVLVALVLFYGDWVARSGL